MKDYAVPTAFLDRTAEQATPLNDAWEFSELAAGSVFAIAELGALFWRPISVPGTVAGALRDINELDIDRGNNLDEREFVFRKCFQYNGATNDASLVFDGLATLCEVWLNGTHFLTTRNMFRRYTADVHDLLRTENELLIHFRALSSELACKRPRGRWTTRLVNHRNLRYVRTTLLGRIPGWTQPHPPVGPWRGIRLVQSQRIKLEHVSLQPTLDGAEGVLSIVLRGLLVSGREPTILEIRIEDHCFPVTIVSTDDNRLEVATEIRIPNIVPWWSHDLGTPHRYPVTLTFKFDSGETLELGTVQIGFRRIEQCDKHAEGFTLRINGLNVFCRGACWTPNDAITLCDDATEIRRVIGLVQEAGMNMLRLSGTMIYESDTFYDICDELGILVWQDFMFANMDYPEGDTEFADEVRIETEQVLARIHHHPCLAVLCGNSEVEQQASMKGLAPDAGRTPLFACTLEEAGRRWCPGTPYVSSSPTGGAMPFHVDAGVAHYFGVGAYLRSLADARESRVRFASECLAFSNVPEDSALDDLFGDEARTTHSPRYKRGVPRDSGSGWDFADVTDHYLEEIFHCNARTVRYADTERYLALARVVPGELMERTIGVWRSEDSVCHGALLWFLRDLQPGSGWGVLDSAGRPKAPYWSMKRACAPLAIWFTDEGLNGLRINVRNDQPKALAAQLRVRLIRSDGIEIGIAGSELRLDPSSGKALNVDALLGRFLDTTYSYRFGPCEHAITVAELIDTDGAIITTAHHLPAGLGHEVREDIALRAFARLRGDGSYNLHIESHELALFVSISVKGYLPTDNYFHIPPRGKRNLILRPIGPMLALRGSITALNTRSHANLETREPPA